MSWDPIDEDREDAAQHREEVRRSVAEGRAWEAEQDMNGGGEPLDSWSAYWIDEAGDAHGLVEGTDRDTARLIASAPDLLEALRLACHRLERFVNPNRASEANREMDKIRAAIAKATGG
jgi:hypothetical protein